MKLKGKLEDYGDLDLALLVLLDVFGSGSARKKALGGHYYRIQSLVNKIRDTGLVPVPSTDFSEEKIRLVSKASVRRKLNFRSMSRPS